MRWKRAASGEACSWVWTSGRRACGRRWSTGTAGRSPMASRRSRRPTRGRPGPSSSRANGGRRPGTAVRSALRRGRRRAGRGGGHRARLHGLHRRGLRRRGRSALSGAALDGPAFLPRGGGHQRDRRPGPAVRLGPGLARVDAAQGALAQAEQARALSIGRADRRGHRLDDAPPDRRLDACRSITSRSNGTTRGRTAAGRSACSRRSGSSDLPEKWPTRIVPLGRGEGRLVPIGGRGPRPARRTSRSPRAGSTPTWGCSAWARPGTATWR